MPDNNHMLSGRYGNLFGRNVWVKTLHKLVRPEHIRTHPHPHTKDQRCYMLFLNATIERVMLSLKPLSQPVCLYKSVWVNVFVLLRDDGCSRMYNKCRRYSPRPRNLCGSLTFTLCSWMLLTQIHTIMTSCALAYLHTLFITGGEKRFVFSILFNKCNMRLQPSSSEL